MRQCGREKVGEIGEGKDIKRKRDVDQITRDGGGKRDRPINLRRLIQREL